VRVDQIVYTLFGNNLVIGPHILDQIERLRLLLPERFRRCRMDDLGCGDGSLTVLLEDVFQPVRLRGYDVNRALVRRARGRGIQAEVLDLNRRMPDGDLAVMWGVLHHLEDPKGCLDRMRRSYARAVVREPVRNHLPPPLELGTPLSGDELRELLGESLSGSEVHIFQDCVFAFWEAGFGGETN